MVHVGKAIAKRVKDRGISKSEFGRRINRAPQSVQHILAKESIDTDLLLIISKVLEFNFFSLYGKDTDLQQLGDSSHSNKVGKLIKENEELAKTVLLLKKTLKEKERLLSMVFKKQSKKK